MVNWDDKETVLIRNPGKDILLINLWDSFSLVLDPIPKDNTKRNKVVNEVPF